MREPTARALVVALAAWVGTYCLSVSAATGAQPEQIQATAADLEDQLILESFRLNFGSGSYGPCTVVLERLGSDVGAYAESKESGKIRAAESALEKARVQVKKLTDYHLRTAMKAGHDKSKAERMAAYRTWIDYQTINPIVAGFQGRRPTASEYARLRQRFTPEKSRLVDLGVEAWKQGSLALFGRTGPITQEEARIK